VSNPQEKSKETALELQLDAGMCNGSPGSAAVLATSQEGWALQPGPSPAGPGAVTLQATLLGKGSTALLGPDVGWL